MRGWNDLGVVETIYEDEQEEGSSSPSSSSMSSPSLGSSSPSSSSLQARVDEWRRLTGCEADVSVRVQEQCFRLHKERLVSSSGYLRRMTAYSSDVTLSPPLPISAEIFTAVVSFCYIGDVALTPANVAHIGVAASLLEMTANDRAANLVEKTEEYFSRAVHPFSDHAAVALPHCLVHLQHASCAGSMAGRCIQTLFAASSAGDATWLHAVASLTAGDFFILAISLRELHPLCHDLLYRIIDQYFEKKQEELTEEESTSICGTIDSRKLSPGELARLVQNARMPLRFVVQAMAAEQLLTRRAVLGGATLGEILRRDAAHRQEAHLKAAMEATGNRIRALEKELEEMKAKLRMGPQVTGRAQSTSCRFLSPEEEKKTGRTFIQGLKNALKKTKLASPEDFPPPRHRRHHSFA